MKLKMESPIKELGLSPRVLEAVLAFRYKDKSVIETIWELYVWDGTYCARTNWQKNGKALLQLEGIGPAAYREIKTRLRLARLPNLREAPRLAREASRTVEDMLAENEGGSSG